MLVFVWRAAVQNVPMKREEFNWAVQVHKSWDGYLLTFLSTRCSGATLLEFPLGFGKIGCLF